MDEDGSTIIDDAAAADVGTEDVAEADSGSETSSKQLTGQQEHFGSHLDVFHTTGDRGNAGSDVEEAAQAETGSRSQASHGMNAPGESGVQI